MQITHAIQESPTKVSVCVLTNEGKAIEVTLRALDDRLLIEAEKEDGTQRGFFLEDQALTCVMSGNRA